MKHKGREEIRKKYPGETYFHFRNDSRVEFDDNAIFKYVDTV